VVSASKASRCSPWPLGILFRTPAVPASLRSLPFQNSHCLARRVDRASSAGEGMRQYGCEQETKTSSRRDAEAARDARGRCSPRRPRAGARNLRGSRATRTHVSRSSRSNRSDGPRSHVTPAPIRSPIASKSRRRAEVLIRGTSGPPLAQRAGISLCGLLKCAATRGAEMSLRRAFCAWTVVRQPWNTTCADRTKVLYWLRP
jgi:hypothetical protein